MPTFTELNPETALAYAHELAAVFGLTLGSENPQLTTNSDVGDVYEFLFIDGTIGSVWFEFGHVYGEA